MNQIQKNPLADGYVETDLHKGTQRPRIALLIKHPHRLSDACQCAKDFMAMGAEVSVVCMCAAPIQKARWNLQPLLDAEAQCHTDNPGLADRYGINWLTPAALGPYLTSIDWAIPF